jgi:hypothetical protein
MALDWNLSKIPHYETICFTPTPDGRQVTNETQAMIWAAQSTGIAKITTANHEQFYHRYLSVCRAQGDSPAFTLHHVRCHVGLWTNATRLTKPQFRKQLLEIIDYRTQNHIEWEKKKARRLQHLCDEHEVGLDG